MGPRSVATPNTDKVFTTHPRSPPNMRDRINYYADGHPDFAAFAAWLRAVDTLILDALGVGLFDLPDVYLRGMFVDGLTSAEVAGDMIEEAIGGRF